MYAMAAPVRRSTRHRVPTKKHDASVRELELALDSALDGDHEDDDSSPGSDFEPPSQENAAEGDQAAVPSSDSSEEMYESMEDDEDERRGEDEDFDVDESFRARRSLRGSMSSRPRKRTARDLDDAETSYNRSIKYPEYHKRSDLSLKYAMGTSQDDHTAFDKSIERWEADLALPSRYKDNKGAGGFHNSFYQSRQDLEANSIERWAWYYQDGGKKAFDSLQQSEIIDENLAITYMASSRGNCDYLMGPLPEQNMYSLPLRMAMDLESHWPSSGGGQRHSTESIKHSRHGWLLNLGESVQCLDWLPNQTGVTQYLAVSTLPDKTVTGSATTRGNSKNTTASSFVPTEPFPASIQIWTFVGTSVGSNADTIDNSIPAQLRLVVCADWGDVKQFKWCPIVRNPEESQHDQGKDYLGLLALITSDGKLRVLDLAIPKDSLPAIHFIRFKSVAFEARPRETVCTCLAWLSSTTIATGCANGRVAIWDVCQTLNLQASKPQNSSSAASADTAPLLYLSLHTTYVASITSLFPSRPSHFVVTLSLSGHLRLTDLRDPYTDTILSQRSRVISPALAWHEQTQHILSADDSYYLRAMNVRRFYVTIKLQRESADVLCMATSPVHASVLVGAADGSVAAMNPVRSIPRTRGRTNWRQIWFWHEWARNKPEPASEDATMTDAEPSTEAAARQLDTGLVRITEGYKLQPTNLTKDSATAGKGPKKRGQPNASETTTTSTIYELKSGVRCLSWNPNIHVGGWAAAGMGSGLLRVEDIALELD